MMTRKPEKSPDDFWRELEEKTGEKVLARSLGQYVSGWEEFDRQEWNLVWGLIIATSGGFRFHHFPQANWLASLFRAGETPTEKTLFLPKDRIVSAELRRETRWWKKLLFPVQPMLVIRYRGDAGEERELLLQTEYKTEGLAEAVPKCQILEQLP